MHKSNSMYAVFIFVNCCIIWYTLIIVKEVIIMKAYYETETLLEALDLMRKVEDGEHGIMLVQNVYKSTLDSNCIVIKYNRA